jgi:hypothetical protein
MLSTVMCDGVELSRLKKIYVPVPSGRVGQRGATGERSARPRDFRQVADSGLGVQEAATECTRQSEHTGAE